MNTKKFINLLGSVSDTKTMPTFNTKKWLEVNDQCGGSCNLNKQIRFKTSMLRSDYFDFRDVYIVAKGKITVGGVVGRDTYNRKLVIKSCGPFTSCIPKINNNLIDNAKDLDILMKTYNLIEYS